MKQYFLLLLLTFCCSAVHAQAGTYEWRGKLGSSCTVTVEKLGDSLYIDVFAWWHTASGQNGNYEGKGLLQQNRCRLTADDCNITLTFTKAGLKATFSDCMAYNLPEDFSGSYRKIAVAVKGNYEVTADKAFFYDKPDQGSKGTAYLLKNDKVNIENILEGGWGYTNYTNARGKTTTGYLLLKDLHKR